MSWLALALASAGFLGGYEVARRAAVREVAQAALVRILWYPRRRETLSQGSRCSSDDLARTIA